MASNRLIAAAGALVLLIAPTTATASPTFPQSYSPETAAGFTNTYTPPAETLDPMCPNAIAGTPGSDPASIALNSALNDASSFVSGGTIHYVYADNPHSMSFDFAIQTCQVTYPADFFSSSDFDSSGLLINTSISKSDLDANGTPIDGASLSGISDPTSNIYFAWTVPAGLPVGTWVCNFSRDIDDSHSGGGNRKVTPVCAQVNAFQSLQLCKVAGPNVVNGTNFAFTVTGQNSYKRMLTVAAGTCTTLTDVPLGGAAIVEKVPSVYEVQSITVDPASALVKDHRTAGKVLVEVGTDPLTVTYTNEAFTCSVVARGVDNAGLRYKTYSLVDPEGIVTAGGKNVSNATVTVTPFTAPTTDPVLVTVTRTSPSVAGHAMIVETNSSGVTHHCDPKV